ncbi:major facilitator superfamily domain-containing protein [Entophlyctis helioformis]|nr:major facilitator superfamily domain-containing protein [Entophlyctis helioformis]
MAAHSTETSPLLQQSHAGNNVVAGGSRDCDSDAAGAVQLLSLDTVIASIGYGRYQHILLLLCGLGWLADTMWMQGIALILPQIQKDARISTTAVGMVFSVFFAGMLAGALVWGVLSDTYGRKLAFTNTLLVSTAAGVGAAFTTGVPALCVAVFALGFGVGGHMPFCPREKQSRLTMLSVFFGVGSVMGALITLVVVAGATTPSTPTDVAKYGSISAWRLVFVVHGLACLVMLVQESPKFLLARGRRDEAAAVLAYVSQLNGSAFRLSPADLARLALDEDVTSALKPAVSSLDAERSAPQPAAHTQPSMFDEKFRKTTVLLFAIWMLVNLGFSMTNAFIAKFMESKGVPASAPASDIDVYINCLVYASSAIPASYLATLMVDVRGLERRGSLALANGVAGIALLVFVWSTGRLAVVASSSLFNFASTVMYGALFTYTPEVYSTAIRGTANGVCGALGRVAGIVAPTLAGLMLTVSIDVPLYVSAFCILLAGVFL